MSIKYSCLLDVNEDNFSEYDVSSAMQSFHFVRSMDMVARIQTVGHLEAVFESSDNDFRKLFKHGRRIAVRSRLARQVNPSPRNPYIYNGYIREARRLPEGKFSATADCALAPTTVFLGFARGTVSFSVTWTAGGPIYLATGDHMIND